MDKTTQQGKQGKKGEPEKPQPVISDDEADDLEWDRQFDATPDVLSRLVAQAKKRYHDGETEELDPDDL